MASSRRHNHKHSSHDLEIKNLDIIENQVEKKMINPEDSSYCQCNICNNKFTSKQKNKAFMKQSSSAMKIKASKMMEFFKLICAINQKTYLRFDIPEICFFYKGEPKVYFKSNNTGVHRTEVKTSSKKQLINLFLENNRSPDTMKNSSSNFYKPLDAHIKHFDTVVPSFKHGDLKQQHQQKTVNFIFHNNPKYEEEPVSEVGGQSSQQICIVKYKQKGFQLLNQKSLRQLLKSLLSQQNVQFIQNYIKPHETHDILYEGHYDITKGIQNKLMHSRSLTHVKMDINLINKFSKDFVPMQHLQDYQNLLKDIPPQFCLYQTYRIVHYIQLMHDITIQKLSTVWLRDTEQQLCFIGLIEFEWSQNKAINVDVGQIRELKQLIGLELTDFEQQLMRAWDSMKSRKQKPQQKVQIDQQKQKQIQKIKLESSMRTQLNGIQTKKSFAGGINRTFTNQSQGTTRKNI